MSNLNESNKTDSNHIKTGWVIAILVGIAVLVVGFYVFNFHKGLSVKNEVWGNFGDYVGGILNPVIAAFAFYLIAKSYELQKRELEATRNLLEVSTNTQKDQIKLAAITALLNSNLTKISLLEAENLELFKSIPPDLIPLLSRGVSDEGEFLLTLDRSKEESKVLDNQDTIKLLTQKNIELEKQIEDYLAK